MIRTAKLYYTHKTLYKYFLDPLTYSISFLWVKAVQFNDPKLQAHFTVKILWNFVTCSSASDSVYPIFFSVLAISLKT